MKYLVEVVGECSTFFCKNYMVQANNYEDAKNEAVSMFYEDMNDDNYDVCGIHHSTVIKDYNCD